MWDEVFQRIKLLKSYDKQFQVSGTQYHRYKANKICSLAEIECFEKKINCQIPQELRSYYLECGNGGVGPFNGILPLDKIQVYQPDLPYPGEAGLREICYKEHPEYISEDGYFEIGPQYLSGLITVMYQEGGHEILIVCNGPQTGEIVYRSGAWSICDGKESLIEGFRNWLNYHIKAFEKLDEMVSQMCSFKEISLKFEDELMRDDLVDLLRSYLNVRKTKGLFDSVFPYNVSLDIPGQLEQINQRKLAEKQLIKYQKRLVRKSTGWWKIW